MITIEQVRQRAEADAKTNGYYLHPDPEFLKDLLEGLKRNEERYGYPSCPCRLASGKFELDRDIFCPCDYRDPDVAEHGCCYCALYVRKDLYEGKTPILPIPERRPKDKQARAYAATATGEAAVGTATEKGPVMKAEGQSVEVKKKLWYCRQCGYVTFREDPPYVCPICKAKREMFAILEIGPNG
ncbi:MAG TPA: ferredoxin-thioredoxin reductase catalytic domain-containing protein [Candidatus Acidoferrales bacterium]|nr:ferredoxin-thioredoxin reductase catalytic domain-containing protein [Candidatus Acidoferrales bacterium]